MVLDVLTVRLDKEQTNVSTTRLAELNFQQLLEMYDEKQATAADVETLLTECQNRLFSFVNPDYFVDSNFNSELNLNRLKMIMELITDGDHYEYAMNELRGVLFNTLHREFESEFNKRRKQYTAKDWADDAITTGMKSLLVDLCKMANIFVSVLKENPAQIPATLGTVIQAVNTK